MMNVKDINFEQDILHSAMMISFRRAVPLQTTCGRFKKKILREKETIEQNTTNTHRPSSIGQGRELMGG